MAARVLRRVSKFSLKLHFFQQSIGFQLRSAMASQLELTQKPFIELQIESLVSENRVKQKKVRKFIEELEARILGIKDLNYSKLLNRDIRVPLIRSEHPKTYRFVPPERLDVIGSFKTATTLNNQGIVDLAVRIPARYFEKKDIKNQRYQHKRALYLAQLAHLLNGSAGLGLIDRLEFSFFRGDLLKPVLLITPKSPELKITFRLFACPDPDSSIKINQLKPQHGNVAPKWFFQEHTFNNLDLENEELRVFLLGDSDTAVSPFYNSSILFDIEAVGNSEIINGHIGGQTSIAEAVVLLKVWLYQRELHHHFSFILTMYVTYLQTRQLIHQNMSSYQIFKQIIKSLNEENWIEGGSYFEDYQDRISSFRLGSPVVFLSPSGNMNLCYDISSDMYNRLKHEVKIARDILALNSHEIFDLLFLKKIDFLDKFDIVAHLPMFTKKMPVELNYLKRLMDHGAPVPATYSETILELLQRAFTDRVLLVQQIPDQKAVKRSWNFKDIPYNPAACENTLSFGFLLDAEKSLRTIDVGPAADTPQAEEFRRFWEPKSQLRLQNGVVSETVVWHVSSFSQRRAIFKYILTHAMRRAGVNNVTVHYTTLERFIDLQQLYFKWQSDTIVEEKENGTQRKRKHSGSDETNRKILGQPLGTGEETFQKILHSYNQLNKVLRAVENPKHTITSIQPMSHHLRASGAFPPIPVSLQKRDKSLKRRKGVTLFPENFDKIGRILYFEPVEILITLDSNGKWPNDSELIDAAKTEYLLQLGEILKSKEYTVKFSEDYLDILFGQFVFRVRVKCQKEITAATPNISRQKRIDLELMPRVHAALDQLYREKPAFSLTCRLVKRWISTHLMAGCISDIAIDLIIAHLFLHPLPYTEPASSLCGFKRFLMLFSRHDWRESPLVINFDNALKLDEVARISNTMQEGRSKLPPLVISTPFDKGHSPWTKIKPTEDDLEILNKICTKGLQFLNDNILTKLDVIDNCKALFRPKFKLFDIMIKLHTHVVQTFFMSIDPPKDFKIVGKEPEGKQPSAFKVMPIVDLNVVERFVSVLREKFDSIASFHYDKYGQRVIGVIMKSESGKLLQGDLNKFFREIKSLGPQLVESVKKINVV